MAAFDYLEYVIGCRRFPGYDEAVSGHRNSSSSASPPQKRISAACWRQIKDTAL